MQRISIILNGITCHYDSVVSIIHTSRNPYDLASISFVLLGAEARHRDLQFDSSLSTANVVIRSYDRHGEKPVVVSINFGLSPVLDSE